MHEDITAFPQSGDEAQSPFEILMCGISYCDGSYKINRPNSPIWCFEYIIKGEGYVSVDGTSFCAEAGDVYILPAGKNHFYYSDDKNPWEKIWMNIRGDLIEKLADCYGIRGIYHIRGVDAYSCFSEFLETAKASENPKEAAESGARCFFKLMQLLHKQIKKENKRTVPGLAKRLKSRLDGVTDFSKSFDEIIDGVYCTKSHAIRVFKAEYGITPYNYLLEKKLSLAKQLLTGTGMSIKEISDYLGFADCHYFSAFFKKQTGFSPRQYRSNSPYDSHC